MSRTPQHPCRLPWKLVHGRILPQGLLEEILEGHLTMQPFLSPKDRRARKRHRRLRHRPAPGGRGAAPRHLVQPTWGHFPPGSGPAPPLCLQNPQTQWEQRGNCPGTPLGQRHGHSRSNAGRCHWRCSLAHRDAHPSAPALPSHLHGKGKCLITVPIPLLPPPRCPQGPSGRVGVGWQGGSRSRLLAAVTGSARGSRVIVPGCFPAGRPRGQLAAASLEQRGLF